MGRVFLAEDGSWGDADNLIVVELTQEQMNILNELNQREAEDFIAAEYMLKLPHKLTSL